MSSLNDMMLIQQYKVRNIQVNHHNDKVDDEPFWWKIIVDFASLWQIRDGGRKRDGEHPIWLMRQ